jgi:uncharacterized protein (TIGR02145 family)
MKRIFTVVSAVIMTAVLFGQVPSNFKYQAVLRDASGNVRVNSNVSIDVAILQGSAIGTQIFIETHVVNTNEFGLVNMEIGSKNQGFSEIEWSAGPYFIKISVDNIEMGTSQLLSVPYALHAKTAENAFSGDYDDLENKPDFTGWDNIESDDFSGSYIDLTNIPSNIDEDKTDDVNLTGNQIIGGSKTFSNIIDATNGLSSNNKNIINVANPVNLQDAATKAYVDKLLQKIDQLENHLGLVKDYEGNLYNTVKIGNQIWMAENLKTTRYSNGDLIGTTTPDTLNISGETTPKYQWAYAGNESNAATYGRLYTWYAVTDSRNVCPAGWHIPSDAEWTALTDYLTNNGYGYEGSGSDIAKSLASTSGWTADETAGNVGNDQSSNNSSGFTALPGSLRYVTGNFFSIGGDGIWWSAIEQGTNYAWCRYLGYRYSIVYRYNEYKGYGLSVRCVKD